MPKNLNTAQAVTRARGMIESAQELTRAAAAVSDSQGSEELLTMDAAKDAQLLDYRVGTVPDALVPVLEALLEAAGYDS